MKNLRVFVFLIQCFITFTYASAEEGLSSTFWCFVCESVILDAIGRLHEKPNISETEFHLQMNQKCTSLLGNTWLGVYCEYEIDQSALQIYDLVVLKNETQAVCQKIGMCSSKFVSSRPSHKRPKLSSASIKSAPDYSFAVMSDLHIGQAAEREWVTFFYFSLDLRATELAQMAVSKINSLVGQLNIQVVFVTGDITDSAMSWQWQQAKQILDGLKVPYIPTLGNHDVWSYNNSHDSKWEESIPTGDQLFAATFKSILQKPSIPNISKWDYNTNSTFNPFLKINSWFQNWMMEWKDFLFFGLDWNTREAAIPGDKGALPTAEIQDFPGGTLEWLTQRIRSYSNQTFTAKNIVFLQHHPFAMPEFVPEVIYSFSKEKKDKIFYQINQNSQFVDRFWGTIAGHLHTWSPRDEKTELEKNEWLTEASKIGSSFSIFSVVNSNIVEIKKFYGYDY